MIKVQIEWNWIDGISCVFDWMFFLLYWNFNFFSIDWAFCLDFYWHCNIWNLDLYNINTLDKLLWAFTKQQLGRFYGPKNILNFNEQLY